MTTRPHLDHLAIAGEIAVGAKPFRESHRIVENKFLIPE